MDKYDPGPLPTDLSQGSWSGLNAALNRLGQAETARESTRVRQAQLEEESARRRNQSNRNKAAKKERNQQNAAEKAAANAKEEERIRQEQEAAKEAARIKREQDEQSAQRAIAKAQEEEKLLANAAAKAKEERRAEIAEKVRLARIQQAKEDEERKSRFTAPPINATSLKKLETINTNESYTSDEIKMLKEYKIILHFNKHYGSFNQDLIQPGSVPRFLNPDMIEYYYFLYLRIVSPISLIVLYHALTKYNKDRKESDNFNTALELIKSIVVQDPSKIDAFINNGIITKDTIRSIGSILHLTAEEQELYGAFVASEPDGITTFTKEEAMKRFIANVLAENSLPGLLVLYTILYKTNNFSETSPYYTQYLAIRRLIKMLTVPKSNQKKTRKSRKSRTRKNR